MTSFSQHRARFSVVANPHRPRKAMVFWMLGGLVLAVACRGTDNRAQARAVLDEWTSAMRAGDTDRAISLYGDAFFAITSREQWHANLHKAIDELGTLESLTVTRVHEEARVSLGKKLVATQFECEAKFSRHPAQMRVVVMRESDGPSQISAHDIFSDGLRF